MGQDRSRKLILARHWDREALSRSLTELSQNESGLLETLQDARGVYRTSEEVFVAVVKVRYIFRFVQERPHVIFRFSSTSKTST